MGSRRWGSQRHIADRREPPVLSAPERAAARAWVRRFRRSGVRWLPRRDHGPSKSATVHLFSAAADRVLRGIDSERGIAWRAADSLALRDLLGLGLTEAPPDHSTISQTRRLIAVECGLCQSPAHPRPSWATAPSSTRRIAGATVRAPLRSWRTPTRARARTREPAEAAARACRGVQSGRLDADATSRL